MKPQSLQHQKKATIPQTNTNANEKIVNNTNQSLIQNMVFTQNIIFVKFISEILKELS